MLQLEPSTVVPLRLYQYRASEWRITYFICRDNGFLRFSAFVFNYDKGLTEQEAHGIFAKNSLTELLVKPPAFHECVCTPLNPWPYPENDKRA